MTEPNPVAEIVADLREDGVHIGPGMARHVDPAEEAAIEAAVARIDIPVHVVVRGLEEDDMFAGSAGDMLVRARTELGTDGWFVAPKYIFSTGDYSLEIEEWTGDAGRLDLPYDATGIAEWLHPDDLGAGLVALTTAIADGTVTAKAAEAREAFDARPDATTTTTDTASDPDSGWDGAAGPVVGGFAVTALAVTAVLLIRLFRRRAGGGALGRGSGRAAQRFTLPPSVLERVRSADDARLRSRAEQDVLALGERIDGTQLTRTANADAWQAALDHYDAARRVLGRDPAASPDLLDVIGAIVLAARGGAALDAAGRGRAFSPDAPCFLNPLHGKAGARRKLDDAGRALDVPVCAACGKDLAAGRRPDILDVVRDDVPVHYFATDAEPWASTGYGALEPDLLSALHARRPRGRR
ncbi:hypothetical protein GHK92_08420 [Nocardioides sp. dk4132]|uniref:hypothetical protein n=1 Tax=unclassified Nocardioides TaxID=2615069 RepID=UPI001296758D|nr:MULTISPECIES: hypothetical protein [unclassified Nocardioides]MQW75895.1 hypothetical protein [Nocardioides sp. dk4132]QGA08758.1 hypothetical protein GFH29_16180 [Nocardioides sp. dk884]